MSFYSDHNGVFIQGMDDANDLRAFIQKRFPEDEIQAGYIRLLEETKALARSEKIPLLKAFWKVLDRAYREKAPPPACDKGCAHCCYTGVMITQLEWDDIVKSAREKNIDLNQIIARGQKSVDRVDKALKSGVDPETIDWHQMVINQPCPFLDDDQTCSIHEDRPLDCRLMLAFRSACESKNLEHAQRGGTVEEAVAPAVIARLQYEQTPKIRRRKFDGTQKLRLLQHWLILWKQKKPSKKKR